MEERIQILLSSYNGAEYIADQIDSILAQRGVSVKIMVRDDGSTDKTMEILEQYKQHGITIQAGNNRGAAESFMELIRTADDCEYYAFADQDDIWDFDKLESAVKMLKNYTHIPAVYSSSTRLVDKDLKFMAIHRQHPRTDLGSAMVKNYAAGCTVVFNKKLMNLLKLFSPERVPYHDWWVNVLALAVGGISLYDEIPHISYRQHGKNVVGAPVSAVKKYGVRFRKFYNTKYRRDKMSRQLLAFYGTFMPEEQKKILLKIAKYRKNKWDVISSKYIRTSNPTDNLLFWILVLFHKI